MAFTRRDENRSHRIEKQIITGFNELDNPSLPEFGGCTFSPPKVFGPIEVYFLTYSRKDDLQ
ncbi:MAG: hypothetical protein V6Z82_00250, partial [Flavobacteriales bacterium]